MIKNITAVNSQPVLVVVAARLVANRGDMETSTVREMTQSSFWGFRREIAAMISLLKMGFKFISNN
jgi:hypothetical protein